MQVLKRTAITALAMLACQPATSGPPATAAGRWLGGLAGSCWHESTFGSDSCFWRSGPLELRRLSRNHGELLECGTLRFDPAMPDRIRASSWDSEHNETALWLFVDGEDLWSYEEMAPRSDGARSTTRWRAIDVNRFELVRQWRDRQGKALPAPASRPIPRLTPLPPASPHESTASLRLSRRPLDAAVAAMAAQCQQWQRLTRQPGPSR